MDKLSEIIRRRSAPGVFIFDMENKLQYSNKEALDMIPELQKTEKSIGRKKQYILDAIRNLCSLAKNSEKENTTIPAGDTNCVILSNESGPPYSLRAFCIGHTLEDRKPTHVMVLIERVVEKRRIDYGRIRDEFKLTKRELDVLALICNGLTNKEISKSLSICEYTVKDHIKNIMRKTSACSRSEIITHTL